MAAPTVRSGNAPMAAAGDSLPADGGDLDARRSDALTWLAPSIAHELANPLAAILTFAGFLARDPRLPADLRGDGRMLREEAERTHRLVRTLLEVARDRPPVMTVVEVVPILDEVLELAGGATVGVELERVVASEIPGVDTDPARLRQLLVILTVEALRGLGDRPAGTLRVDVTPNPGGDTVLVRFEYRHRGGHGPASGVPATPTGETQVPSVGGRLLVEAEDDGGRLTLRLSIAGGRQAGAASRGSGVGVRADAERPTKPITVLVCDDEDAIRALLVRVLERDGLRALDAADGPSALEILESTDVDVVVTDHRMAGMSGIALYDKAVDARPQLGARFVVMSGEPRSEELVRFTERTGVRVLPKPFDVQVVAATVREVAAADG